MAPGLESSCLDRLSIHSGFFIHLSGTWAGWGTLLLFGLSTWLAGTSQHTDLKVVRLFPWQLASPGSMLRDQGREGRWLHPLALEIPSGPLMLQSTGYKWDEASPDARGRDREGAKEQATIFNSPPHVSHPLRAAVKTLKDGMPQSH